MGCRAGKIRLTAKGAAWLALRKNGFIVTDLVDDNRGFEAFWTEYSAFLVQRIARKMIYIAVSSAALGIIVGFVFGIIV